MINIQKRRKNIRLQQYDYRSPGYYYVTLCSHNRACIFGDIAEAEMILSPNGEIVDSIWQTLPDHFLNVSLDWMQLMPNHLHAIIIIDEQVHTLRNDPKPFNGEPTLGQIVGYWKYQASKAINRNQLRGDFIEVWQPNMFEHIIRNERELQAFRTYIQNNPGAWFDDIENPVNLARLREAEANRNRAAFLPPGTIIQGAGAGTAPLQ